VFAQLRKLRNRREQRGAAALEFGLIACFVFLPLMLGIIQYGWYFYVSQTTGGATTHVARRMAVGDCWGTNEASTFVSNEVGSAGTTKPSVTFAPTSNSTAEIGTTQLTVTVTTQADVVGFWPMPNGGTITRTVKTMIEDLASSGAC
jgi:Flp pilus assembly protein TadG